VVTDDNTEARRNDVDPIRRRSKREMRMINVLIVLTTLWIVGRAMSPKFAEMSQKLSTLMVMAGLILLWVVHAHGLRQGRQRDRERKHFLTTHDSFLMTHDPLTKLHNSHFLIRRIEEEIERSKRYASPFCMLYLGLDRFEDTVSAHGQEAAERVLLLAADRLRDICLVTDTLGRELGRVGRERFLLLMPETEPSGGYRLAQRVMDVFHDLKVRLPDDSQLDSIGICIGAAAYPYDGQTRKVLIEKASEALVKAQKVGGSYFVDSRASRRKRGKRKRR